MRGGRVGTVLLYCSAPELGGATAFPAHGGEMLKVAPEAGSAVFFSYDRGAEDSLHAGCAVRAGTKRVVSIFLRDGVDAALPWSAVDVDGVVADFGVPDL